METNMSEFTASSPTLPTRLPAEMPVYAACGGLALCTFLSWLSIDFGGVFDGTAEHGAEGGRAALAMAGMFRHLEAASSVSGLRLVEGKLALLAALATAGLTWGEVSGMLRQDPRTLRLGAAAAAAIGALSVLFACTRTGGPLGLSFGFFLAAIAAIAGVVIAVRRVKALPTATAATAPAAPTARG
jgi:hypothetical protein